MLYCPTIFWAGPNYGDVCSRARRNRHAAEIWYINQIQSKLCTQPRSREAYLAGWKRWLHSTVAVCIVIACLACSNVWMRCFGRRCVGLELNVGFMPNVIENIQPLAKYTVVQNEAIALFNHFILLEHFCMILRLLGLSRPVAIPSKCVSSNERLKLLIELHLRIIMLVPCKDLIHRNQPIRSSNELAPNLSRAQTLFHRQNARKLVSTQ